MNADKIRKWHDDMADPEYSPAKIQVLAIIETAAQLAELNSTLADLFGVIDRNAGRARAGAGSWKE